MPAAQPVGQGREPVGRRSVAPSVKPVRRLSAARTLKGPATDTKQCHCERSVATFLRGLDCKTGMHPVILPENKNPYLLIWTCSQLQNVSLVTKLFKFSQRVRRQITINIIDASIASRFNFSEFFREDFRFSEPDRVVLLAVVRVGLAVVPLFEKLS